MKTVTAPGLPSSTWWAQVREDARCVLDRDPAARSLLEVWTIYPGVQAIAIHRLSHALWQRGWRYLPRWLSFVSRCLTQVDIHPGAKIGPRFFIDHVPGGVIGETAEVGLGMSRGALEELLGSDWDVELTSLFELDEIHQLYRDLGLAARFKDGAVSELVVSVVPLAD